MAKLRSTRSCSHARTSERGYALAVAVILAVLYFGLIELLMVDASRELAEARRYRARVAALTLAENGVELAAERMVDPAKGFWVGDLEHVQGKISGKLMKNAGGIFDIEAEGKTIGTEKITATVRVRGRVIGNDIRIDYTTHSQ